MNRPSLFLDHWNNSSRYYLLATFIPILAGGGGMNILLKSNDDLAKFLKTYELSSHSSELYRP